MDLHDLISPSHIVASLNPGSKKQLLQELAELASEKSGLSSRQIFDTLLQRERLGSTGVGNGIAIPHGKISELNEIFGLFVRLEKPVNFDATDDQPVDLVFLLLAPEGAGAEHLKALSRVARVLRDENTVNKIRQTSDISTIYALLSELPKSNAA